MRCPVLLSFLVLLALPAACGDSGSPSSSDDGGGGADTDRGGGADTDGGGGADTDSGGLTDSSRGLTDATGTPEAGSSGSSSGSTRVPDSGEAGPSCPTPVPADPLATKRAACAFDAGALAQNTISPVPASLPIAHVIVLMKENRSYDQYLGQLYRRGQPDSEPQPSAFSNPGDGGAPVAAYHETTTCNPVDPIHSWQGMHAAVDDGRMDGFVRTSGAATMGYFDDSDLPFYYFLANTFAVADHHFSSVLGPTFPNRDYLVLATSDGIDCTCSQYPPATTPSLTDLLDRRGIAWGAYSEENDPFENCLGSAWRAQHAASLHTVVELEAALARGDLPAVAFVDSKENVNDEHPPADVQAGEAWTRDVYEAVVASPAWPTTAMFLTYDEAGGFADHLPPPHSCAAAPSEAAFFELGVRVPMIVVSPWARRHYVSHVVHEHASLARFIELVFGLPALTARDANTDAMLDMFDFACASPGAPPAAPPAGTGGCR